MRRKYPGLVTKDDASWRAIEAAAKAQARDYFDDAQVAPAPEWGSFVAWSEHGYRGATAGMSVVHRVGPSAGRLALTLCGERLPDAQVRLELSAPLIRALGRCHRCDAAYAKGGLAA